MTMQLIKTVYFTVLCWMLGSSVKRLKKFVLIHAKTGINEKTSIIHFIVNSLFFTCTLVIFVLEVIIYSYEISDHREPT